MISKSILTETETKTIHDIDPIDLHTANGPVSVTQAALIDIPRMRPKMLFYLLDGLQRPILSVGALCKAGYRFEWSPTKGPSLYDEYQQATPIPLQEQTNVPLLISKSPQNNKKPQQAHQMMHDNSQQSDNTIQEAQPDIFPETQDPPPPPPPEFDIPPEERAKQRRQRKKKPLSPRQPSHHNIFTHFPKDPNCPICNGCKPTRTYRPTGGKQRPDAVSYTHLTLPTTPYV